MGLEWNVYIERDDEIQTYNVFDHFRFMNDLFEIDMKCKDNFKTFAKEVKKNLAYYFWSKYEWEIVLTSFPPYVDNNEIDRLNKERDECIEKYGRVIKTPVGLKDAWKTDVYEQVLMNWNHFINYLWENRKWIKKCK